MLVWLEGGRGARRGVPRRRAGHRAAAEVSAYTRGAVGVGTQSIPASLSAFR